MKEDLVLIEDFSIIFKNVIMYMNVNLVHLMLILIKKYLYGNQHVILIMIAVKNASGELPDINANNDDVYVYLSGNHFQQDIPNFNNNIINIYCVYKLDPISSSGDNTFTVQNALFGSMQITKNVDTSKYKYKGYGICFDEGGAFGIGNTNNGRNVLIFGVHENSLVHANNKANNIFIMGDGFVQGINDTTLYAEKKYIAKILLNQTKSLC